MLWDAESRQGQYETIFDNFWSRGLPILGDFIHLYPLFAAESSNLNKDLMISSMRQEETAAGLLRRAIWQWKRESFDMLSKSTAMRWPRYSGLSAKV